MGTDLVVYKSSKQLLTEGLYFQLWMRLAAQAKRAMRRRKHYLVKEGRVITKSG